MAELLSALGRRLGLVAPDAKDHRAGVYQRPEVMLVHANAKTTAGVFLVELPAIRLNPAPTSKEVGAAVRKALGAFRTGVAHPGPSEWGDVGKPFLAAAGFRSWRTLEDGAKMSSVTQKADGSFVFSITRNGGTRGDQKGFQGFGDPDQHLAAGASDAELGAAVLKALESCEIARPPNPRLQRTRWRSPLSRQPLGRGSYSLARVSLLACLAMALTSQYADVRWTDPGEIWLIVIDRDSSPLPGVTIELRAAVNDSKRRWATTDREGRADFHDVAAGEYVLRLELSGFVTYSIGPVTMRSSRDENPKLPEFKVMMNPIRWDG